jgi:hypothetical protein
LQVPSKNNSKSKQGIVTRIFHKILAYFGLQIICGKIRYPF